jgi:S1-C subfamily serine protease
MDRCSSSPSSPRLPGRRPGRPLLARCLALVVGALAATGVAAVPTAVPTSSTTTALSAGSARPVTGLTAGAEHPARLAVRSERTASVAVPVADPAIGDAPDGQPISAARIAQLVSPTVVNINTVVGYRGVTAAGTGIVLTPNGDVLTNNHVINGATSIRATDVGNGRTYQAAVLGYDRGHDIAVLRLTGASGLRTAKLGDSNTLRVGDPIAAVGNAGGAGGRPKVATGRVTALGRAISPTDELTGTVERLTGLIEVAANVQPGDSGGPLVTSAAEVVGVDTAASANYRYFTAGGTGYAIPINSAMAIARQIQAGAATDTVHVGPTPMLGVSVVSSGNRFGRDSDGYRTGVTVTGVPAGSPAQRAGVAPGDVILGFDGTDVDSANTLTNMVLRHRPGDRVALVWASRAGQQRTARVTLVAGPPA